MEKKQTQSNSNSASKTKPAKKSKKRKSQLSQPPYQLFEENANDAEKSFQNGINAVVNLLSGRKKIVVLCGAGMSVSCGIPDFRSKGGIYDMIDTNELGLSTPEEIFHFEVFQDDPRPFYRFAGEMLYPKIPHTPSPSHRFLAMLEEKKMLLRVYTQNIDGLEEKAGVSPKKIVYAHGSLNASTCLKCGMKVDSEELRDDVLKGQVPYCKKVVGKRRRRTSSHSRTNMDPKDSTESTVAATYETVFCGGVMKPNITFFGEALVDRVRRCLESDQAKADAVIVIGTSLSVAPISKVIEYLRPSIPRILINRKVVVPKHGSGVEEEPGDSGEEDDEKDHRNGYLFDAIMLGFCDEVTKALAHIMVSDNHSKERALHSNEVDDRKEKEPRRKKQKLIDNSNSKEDQILPFRSDDCRVLYNDPESLNKIGAEATCLLNHPAERVLLFPGAVLEAEKNEDEDDATKYHEIIHCDECNQIIKGVVMKCVNCFDYDLCKKCYGKVAHNHYGGKHKFVEEK